MKKELMAKKMKYSAKKGGAEWQSSLRKGTQSLNIPRRDIGAKMNNMIGEGKNENNNS